MTKYLCKDCWLQHDVDTLLAACDECTVRTRERLEPLRERRHPGARNGSLTCKIHNDEPLHLFCNSCRHPVPSGTFGDRSVLAVVGDTDSGKTTLMWVVTGQALRSRSKAGLAIQTAIGDSDDLLKATVAPIFTPAGKQQTKRTDADVRNYAWELKLPNGARGNWLLAFHDAAGEIWRDLAQLSPEMHPALRRFLKLVGSVVFTIDGDKLLEALDVRAGSMSDVRLGGAENTERRIAEALQHRFHPRKKIPLAIAVTKADVFWDRKEWALFHPESKASRKRIDRAVKQLLQLTGRGPLIELLESSFEPISYFAVSAFGCRPFPGFRPEDVQSSRVEEPIATLLNL